MRSASSSAFKFHAKAPIWKKLFDAEFTIAAITYGKLNCFPPLAFHNTSKNVELGIRQHRNRYRCKQLNLNIRFSLFFGDCKVDTVPRTSFLGIRVTYDSHSLFSSI